MCSMLVFCLVYSSSETSVDIHRTPWRYVPEDRTAVITSNSKTLMNSTLLLISVLNIVSF
jgi:hypothetical protein